MLPGFRFLFAAIVLSMSALVFGLGAAAVLRAAHEQFAESGSWRPAPEALVAQQSEMTPPVLASLRVDPPVAAPKAADIAPALLPAQPSDSAAPPAPDRTATLDPQAASPSETAKPDTPEVTKTDIAPEATKAQDSATQAPVVAAVPAPPAPGREEMPPAPPAAVEAPAAIEAKAASSDVPPPAPATAATVSPPPASEPAAASSEAAAPAQDETDAPAAADPATSGIATLGGSPVAVGPTAPDKAVRATRDPSEARKQRDKARAEERARQRRRLLAARRARLARQATEAQQAANPFGQASQTTQYAQPGLAGATNGTR